MPAGLAFHGRYPLALYRMHNDTGWFIGYCLSFFNSLMQLIKVMTIHFDDMPLESSEFFWDWQWRQDLSNITIDLQAVEVDKSSQVIELVVTSEHRCFPHLPFFQLTITQDGIHASWRLV